MKRYNWQLLVAMLCVITFGLAFDYAIIRAQTTPAPAPFTPLESARLDALAQEGRALDAEQRTLTLLRERWQGKVAAFKADAEKSRVGWTWDADTGKWSEVEK